jgi:UDP-N-acetyl-D-mannosaminuronate dehydrogenase
MVELAENYQLEHIWIHGKAYKPNVPNCEGSYSLLIGHYIEEMGRKVKYVDPLTGDVHTEVHGVVLMAHHAPTTYDNTAMEQITQQNFYCGFTPGSVIVDVWRYLTQADVPKCTLVSYGNTRTH